MKRIFAKIKLFFRAISDKYYTFICKAKVAIRKIFSRVADFFHIPSWVRREVVIFGSMFWEAGKFILVAIISFILVYGIMNAPAIHQNIRYWFFTNYRDEAKETLSYWGIKLPDVSARQATKDELVIPKIGVEAPIVFLKATDEKSILTALRDGVVHYSSTALPGERGNVFITGHSSYYWWSGGKYNSVFSLLDKLVIGDEVYISYKGKRYTYIVSSIKIVSPQDKSVLDPTSEPSVTMMTCTPLGTSFKRLIVRARQVDPSPEKDTLPPVFLPKI